MTATTKLAAFILDVIQIIPGIRLVTTDTFVTDSTSFIIKILRAKFVDPYLPANSILKQQPVVMNIWELLPLFSLVYKHILSRILRLT
jgi:hypothetical protein